MPRLLLQLPTAGVDADQDVARDASTAMAPKAPCIFSDMPLSQMVSPSHPRRSRAASAALIAALIRSPVALDRVLAHGWYPVL